MYLCCGVTRQVCSACNYKKNTIKKYFCIALLATRPRTWYCAVTLASVRKSSSKMRRKWRPDWPTSSARSSKYPIPRRFTRAKEWPTGRLRRIKWSERHWLWCSVTRRYGRPAPFGTAINSPTGHFSLPTPTRLSWTRANLNSRTWLGSIIRVKWDCSHKNE